MIEIGNNLWRGGIRFYLDVFYCIWVEICNSFGFVWNYFVTIGG